MNLINTARNRELLEAVPHKDVMDLSVIYRIIMEKQGDGLATVLLNHELMKEMDISNEELERLAYENTARMFPVEIMKLAETLYVMTNRSKLHGATTMLYKDAVRQLADAVGAVFSSSQAPYMK